jgi:hypothetical protein
LKISRTCCTFTRLAIDTSIYNALRAATEFSGVPTWKVSCSIRRKATLMWYKAKTLCQAQRRESRVESSAEGG